MSDHTPDNPYTGDTPSSDEYAFEEGRNPLEATQSEQAKASEYGIYGYIDHAGEEVEAIETPPPTPDPRAEQDDEADIDFAEGGKRLIDTDHGAGFDQPMDQPQRDASRSKLPDSYTPPEAQDTGD